MLKIASTSVPSGCLALDMASAKCTSKHSVFHRDFLVLILISFPFQSKPCWFSRKTRRYRRSITRVGQRHIVNKPWHRGLNEQTKLIQNDRLSPMYHFSLVENKAPLWFPFECHSIKQLNLNCFWIRSSDSQWTKFERTNIPYHKGNRFQRKMAD